jgi:hypothetical protein
VAAPNEFKKRALHASDLAGIQDAYAGVGTKTDRQLASPCNIKDRAGASCAAVHGKPPELWEPGLILALLGLTRWLLKRRQIA